MLGYKYYNNTTAKYNSIIDASSSLVIISRDFSGVYIPSKLGIGTSTINNALDVSGTVNILGNIKLNNQTIVIPTKSYSIQIYKNTSYLSNIQTMSIPFPINSIIDKSNITASLIKTNIGQFNDNISLTYGFKKNSAFVLSAGNGKIVTSTNGINWSVVNTRTNAAFQLSWNGSYWLGITYNSEIIKSIDGIGWSSLTTKNIYSSGSICMDLIWLNNKWFTFGGTEGTASSTDGISWSIINSFPDPMKSTVRVARNKDLFLAILTNNTTYNMAKSTDGITWSCYKQNYCSIQNNSYIKFYNSLWFIYGGGTFVSSSDGITWSNVGNSLLTVYNCLTWNGTLWIAGGGETPAGCIIISSNLINWSVVGKNSFEECHLIDYNHNLIVAVGRKYASPINSIAYSSNGKTWSNVPASADIYNNKSWLSCSFNKIRENEILFSNVSSNVSSGTANNNIITTPTDSTIEVVLDNNSFPNGNYNFSVIFKT
jgi:hypothetical protein